MVDQSGSSHFRTWPESRLPLQFFNGPPLRGDVRPQLLEEVTWRPWLERPP